VIREIAEGKLTFSGISGKMTDRVRIIRHEIVPLCGSYEVRIVGQPSRYFYWDSVPSRRLRPDQLTKEEALAQAQALARAERDKGG
jgi:predicted DNA-binding transcriptional regulator YafY